MRLLLDLFPVLLSGSALTGVWLAARSASDPAGWVVTILAGGALVIWALRQHQGNRARAEDDEFREITQNAPVMLWVSDSSNRRFYFNANWLEFTGRTLREEQEYGWMEGIAPDDRQRYLDVVEAAMKEKRAFSVEFRLRHRSGIYRWVASSGVPRRSKPGETPGYIGSCIDIHERKEAEDALKKSEEGFRAVTTELERLAADLSRVNSDLEAQNRAIARAGRQKSMFLTTMSHELQTPLNAICGFVDLLAEERAGSLNEKQRKYVAHIRNGSNHLLRVIGDILDLSRIETGHLQLEWSDFNARDAVNETVAGMASLAAQKKIQLRLLHVDDGLLRADRTRFSQILYNLVSNAIKYTPSGGSVTVEGRRGEEFWEFAVEDTGVGIPEEQQEAIFSEFHQVDSSAFGATKGTGLGLTITKSLVECHGGRITVQSKPGEGSRFLFTLRAHVSNNEMENCVGTNEVEVR